MVFGSYYKTVELFEELYKKHFKWHYAGKPTKRYLRITEQLVKTQPYYDHNEQYKVEASVT